MTMITPTWTIKETKRIALDGYVFETTFQVDFNGNTVEGAIPLERPEQLIPYENLTEQQIVDWVKQQLGEDILLEIEQRLQNQEDQANTAAPAQDQSLVLFGLPWQ